MPYTINELPMHSSIVEELKRISERIQDLETYRTRLLNESAFASLLLSRLPENSHAFWLSNHDAIILMVSIPVAGFTLEAAPELCKFLEYIIDYYDVFPTSTDEPNEGSRRYRFAGWKTEHELIVHVTAELQPDSEACQRIVTGTQKVMRYRPVEVDEVTYSFKC